MTEPHPTSLGSRARRLLGPLASPRLTVLLLALSIVLVFAGTMAQMNQSLWEVLHDYFRSPLVFIPLGNFFPSDWGVSVKAPFPGGYTIGLMMLINLVAAHVARFRVQARAWRLVVGAALIVLGGGLIAWFHNGPLPGRIMASAGGYQGVLPLMAAGAGFYAPIVIGCAITFGRRAGIVLIHGALILLLVGEGVTSTLAVETQMPIYVGATSNWAQDIREVELAIIDPSSPDSDLTLAIPESRLARAARTGEAITDPLLPFSVRVVRYYSNSTLGPIPPSGTGDALATHGFGISVGVAEIPRVSGVAAPGSINVPAAYVRFEQAGGDLGTYLVSPNLQLDYSVIAEQEVRAGDRTYRIAMRFRRYHKPYELRLDEFHHDVYPGTNVPRNFSSDLHLGDPEHAIDQDVTIQMNNPLRYGGDTLFQSGWIPGDNPGEADRGTVLMVVRNPGWTIPYIACALGTVGLFCQFGFSLTRFLRRRTP